MSVTIEFGWWVLPAVVTLMAFGLAAYSSRNLGKDQYGVGAYISLGFYLVASVFSLLAWLAWSLLR